MQRSGDRQHDFGCEASIYDTQNQDDCLDLFVHIIFYYGHWIKKLLFHSMARANLNKSEVFLTNNTAASIFYEENLVSQCAHLEVLLLSKFGSERGDFN